MTYQEMKNLIHSGIKGSQEILEKIANSKKPEKNSDTIKEFVARSSKGIERD